MTPKSIAETVEKRIYVGLTQWDINYLITLLSLEKIKAGEASEIYSDLQLLIKRLETAK